MINNLAYYYDYIMQDDQAYEDWSNFVVKHCEGKKNNCLELACGSGTLTLALARKGFNITGLDLSYDMLSIAKNKMVNAGLRADFILSDMVDFQGSNFDLIYCFGDSYNFLEKETDILASFKCVKKALANDGIFMFDINSLERFALFEQPYDEVFEEKDFKYRWQVSLINKNTIKHQIEIEKDGKIMNEEHFEYTYEVKTYLKLLKEAGFSQIKVYTDFDYQGEISGDRYLFVVKC